MSAMPGAELDLPPTDDDRKRVIDLIRGASARLGLDEAERRMDAAVKAGSRAELALLMWDLPADAPAQIPGAAGPKASAWQSLGYRLHSTAYALTNGMLVGIWGLTDRHDLFWPFFPIAGWGIGLAAHATIERHNQRRRQQQQERRLERAARGELPGTRRPRTARAPQGAAEVVVMFTDMVDSTRLNMVLGDEDWLTVRNRLRRVLQDSYRSHRGQEVNTAGDGFLARFEEPADAAACAVDIQRRIQSQRQEMGFAPAVRIGIHAGTALEERGDVLGSTVNLASRVTSAAQPREILVTEAVADRLDGRFELHDEGLRDLKGLDRTAHVLSLAWR